MAGALSPEVIDGSGLLTFPSPCVDCSTEESRGEFDSPFTLDVSLVLDVSFIVYGTDPVSLAFSLYYARALTESVAQVACLCSW